MMSASGKASGEIRAHGAGKIKKCASHSEFTSVFGAVEDGDLHQLCTLHMRKVLLTYIRLSLPFDTEVASLTCSRTFSFT